jgi:hypothetical protein
MKRNIILIVLFAVFSLYFASCAKDGEIGPAGNDGNANVTTIIFTNLVWKAIPGNASSKQVTLTISSITQDIVNKGTIQVSSSGDGKIWTSMTFAYLLTSWTFTYSLNTLNLILTELNNIFNPGHESPYAKVTIIAGS